MYEVETETLVVAHLEGQINWTLHRYELCALERHSFDELVTAVHREGSSPLLLGADDDRRIEYSPKEVRVFTGPFGKPAEQTTLWAGAPADAVRLVLDTRSADPEAAKARDLKAAARVLKMREGQAQNARRWLTDPEHPAHTQAKANRAEYERRRDQAEAELTAQEQAMAEYAAQPLPEAPSPLQPNLF